MASRIVSAGSSRDLSDQRRAKHSNVLFLDAPRATASGSDGFDRARAMRRQSLMQDLKEAILEDLDAAKNRSSARRSTTLQGLHADGVPRCVKCEEAISKNAADKEKYFKELEHLRRGISKVIEQAKLFMPLSILRQLMIAVQLDVRYLSNPGNAEEMQMPVIPPAEYDEGSLEKLRAQIQKLEEKVSSQAKIIAEQDLELKKAREALKMAGLSVQASSLSAVSGQTQLERRDATASKESQTDTAAFPPGLGARRSTGQMHNLAPGQSQVEAANGSHLDDHWNGSSSRATGIDPRELERMKAEMELLKMKVASAERQLGELEMLKAAKAALERERDEKDKQLAQLKQSLKELESAKNKSGGDDPQSKANSQDKNKGNEDKKGKKQKQVSGRGTDEKTTTSSGGQSSAGVSGSRTKRRLITTAGGSEEDGADSETDEDDEDEETSKKVVMEDKCVGNGPGKGMQDEPVICRGRACLKKEESVEELNKTGRIYECQLRPTPDLGLTSSNFSPGSAGLNRSLPSTSPVMGSHPSKGERSFASTSPVLGSHPSRGKMASDWSSKSAGHFGLQKAQSWQETEPYLLQVWEQQQKGPKFPAKRELIRLGALSPLEPRQLIPEAGPSVRSSTAA